MNADDVLRVAHEGQGDQVGPEFQSPAQIGLVLLREGWNIDGDTRQVDALVVAHRARDDDLGRDNRPIRRQHFELDLAVVDEQRVAGLHIVGQAFEGGAANLPVADDLVGGDLEDVADGEVIGSVLELAETDLRALQVDEHCDGATGIGARLADVAIDLLVYVIAAVAEVHASHVDSGVHDRPDVLVARGCRAECGDDFCASHVFLSLGCSYPRMNGPMPSRPRRC